MRRSHLSNRMRRVKAAAFVLLALAVISLAVARIYAPERTDALAATLFEREKPDVPAKISSVMRPKVGAPRVPRPAAQSMTGAAYRIVAPDLPGISPESVGYARQSILDPSWGFVRVEAPDRNGYYAVFVHREGKSWQAERSLILDEYTNPNYLEPVLRGIPEDLSEMLFFGTLFSAEKEGAGDRATSIVKEATDKEDWRATSEETGDYHAVEVENKDDEDLRTRVYLKKEDGLWEVVAVGEDLTSAEAPGFPADLIRRSKTREPEDIPAHFDSTEPVVRGVEPERVRDGLEAARKEVEDYPGIAGFYARDLERSFSYGVRPEEEFFAASVIKVPVMVAVFRRIDQGKLSLDDFFEIREEDKAPGSGGLQYEETGPSQSVEDLLWLMITRSDNVATNVLIRAVGGEEYVNEVSESLGATDTILRRRITVERAAVPAMDNQTTPEDMAEILTKIYTGQAASEKSCEQMVDLLRHNRQEIWLEAGVPPDVPVANKGGWLDSTFNDVGIVEYEKRPYVLAIFTKYGANDIDLGGALIAGISEEVWDIQSPDKPDKKSREKDNKEEEKK